MSLSIGIVGLPNVGKSTLFNALLGKAQAAASNFPFCTIEPNVGTVPVPDYRLLEIAEWEKSAKITPTTIEFVDIAGLVKDAHKGQGLGNQFLSHIREVDAIIQVVRFFNDKNITHVTDKDKPLDDMDIIDTELLLADLQVVEKRLGKEAKAAKANPKLQPKVDLYKKLVNHLGDNQPVRNLELSHDEKILIKELNLLSIKPILYVANIDDEQLKDIDQFNEAKQSLNQNNKQLIFINAKTESEIAGLDKTDQATFLEELNLSESGLNQVIKNSYQLLDVITFFTAGPTEARAWTVKKHSLAPQAAGVIHTDFEKGFIKAEIINYDQLKEIGSLKQAAEKGLIRLEGKNYEIKDGDIALFKFNV